MVNDNIRRFFIAAWLLMGITLAFHQVFLNELLPTSPYDSRGFSLEKQVRRGGIYDRCGELLANTQSMGKPRDLLGASWAHSVGYHIPGVGETGLELRFSRELSGNDSPGDVGRIVALLQGKEAVGAELYTTLDRRWQVAAVRALGNRKGAVVVLNPGNGEILAMVSRPGFELRELENMSDLFQKQEAPLLNRATSGLYPPGSLFKLVVAAAAIRYHMEQLEFECTGSTLVNGHVIHDAEKASHGHIGLEEALSVSCNSYFIKLGSALGEKRLKSEARRWGLNSSPPICIASQSGRYPEASRDLASLTIGQGELLVTPLQMARAYGIVASGGTLPPLHLVQELRYPWCQGTRKIAVPPAPRIISTERAERLFDGLRGVVTNGTGWRSNLSEVIVAGKTGTAETGETTSSHAWFAAIGEWRGERRVVLVLVEYGGSGGRVAAPIAREIMKSAQRGEYW